MGQNGGSLPTLSLRQILKKLMLINALVSKTMFRKTVPSLPFCREIAIQTLDLIRMV